MTSDLAMIGKALAAACSETREGQAADAIGGDGETRTSYIVSAADAAGGIGAAGGNGTGYEGDGGGAGVVPAFVVLPGSTDEAVAVMRVAAEHELAIVARGGGSRLWWGTPPSRADLVIDMSRMNGVVFHAAGDLVARVQAGARMGDVAAVLAAAGQEIALDVPSSASVGGVVGSGLAGPRRLRYGTPRDLLIGITIVRADGTVAKSGGKVVKNVAGYDLGKLMAGAAGTLALVTEATFRLHPLPAAAVYVTAEYVAVPVACDAVAAAANSPLVASAVELSRAEPGGPIQVGVLLEGSADGVAQRALRMADLLGKAETALTPPDWWPGAPEAAAGATLIRVSFWVSALARVLDAIDGAAAAAGVSPVVAGSAGAGVLYLHLRPSDSLSPGSIAQTASIEAGESANDPERSGGPGSANDPERSGRSGGPERSGAVAEFVRGLRRGAGGRRGSVSVLAAPGAVWEALGVGAEHGTVPAISLMRAVKEQFDPGHRMSPGRFPEGI